MLCAEWWLGNPSSPIQILIESIDNTSSLKMPTATVPTVSEDQIEDLVYDLLYLSRTGETPELRATIDLLAENLCCMPSTIINSAVDPASGNGLLHMASANGHTGKNTFSNLCKRL